MKKRPKNLLNTDPQKTFGYVSLRDDKGNLITSNKALSKSFDKLDAIQNISVAHDYSLQNLLPGISGRQPFGRKDYEHFRPNEAIPRRYDDIIKACDVLYISNGLVRYVIDLMSDFACQGIRLSHPVKSEQKFYQDWFEKVCGQERSERFLNYLYRHNMVTVVNSNAKIKGKTAFASDREVGSDTNDNKNVNKLPPAEIKYEQDKVKRGQIPLKYTFLHPSYVNPKNKLEALKQNPEYLYQPPLSQYLNGKDSYPLNKDNTNVYFYKKDDWVIKPIPFLWALIPHAIMIDKLNLADSAALDGAASRVRIFKLGNIDKNLFPDDNMVSKLENILLSNVGGGNLDIIWDETIQIEESKADVTVLGEEKFVPHLEQLYIGLGVPPTLIGIGSGTTNNLISLKTFVQRLQYGRQQLINFWRKQIKIVQKAMGFSRPAIIEFDFIDLGEEAALRKLLMDMADRNIISDERLLELLGHDADMEKIRVNREERERKTGRRANKTGPWHDPQFEISLQKVALQRGYVSPEQVDVPINPEYKDDETPFEMQLKSMEKKSANSGGGSTTNKQVGTPGRPKNSKDTQKRKTKQFSPKMKAAQELWANKAYKEISDIIKPIFFKVVGKRSLVQLTTEEINAFEYMKFATLCKFDMFDDITEEKVREYVTSDNKQNHNLYKIIAKDVKKDMGQDLTLEQMRQIQIFVYTNQLV